VIAKSPRNLRLSQVDVESATRPSSVSLPPPPSPKSLAAAPVWEDNPVVEGGSGVSRRLTITATPAPVGMGSRERENKKRLICRLGGGCGTVHIHS
jgi:hypothetical protein